MKDGNQISLTNNNEEQLLLKAKIKLLQHELEEIEQKTKDFENTLRYHLTNEIIEVQELTVLYKKLKLAKKEKRLSQKQKGKNYKETVGLKVIPTKRGSLNSIDNQKKLKQLYREAMLQVHPDKFLMNDLKVDLATEVTTKLIEIYQTGNLEELQLFHTHIFSGNALMQSIDSIENKVKDTFLQKEIELLNKNIELAKIRHTYKVLLEYPNPLSFIDELKEFYNDRIVKLKKRTRKAV
ncbi:hypothetical protein [Lutibacter sp.]|uniref:hypothetical protein n=1 Tax=Lutibacter sp. TaxID=1925666 RepID=UPI0027345467|nr:hypothetical protein [Lutibacter sp.]MDP3312205.1 hypothetical protein [Lutibacter sp.]